MQRVIAITAAQRVIAGATIKSIVFIIAGQSVVEIGPRQVLDLGEPVALRITAGSGTGFQIDRHSLGRSAVISPVGPVAPIQYVCTRATDQGI